MNAAKKPHKHAEVIKAWADGAEIEVQRAPDGEWFLVDSPHWYGDYGYRVKPREFPKSSLSYGTLCDIINAARSVKSSEGHETIALRMCADAAVKQYILDTEQASAAT